MKTGYNGRKRFSLLYPDGTVERWGCCDPKIDSGRIIMAGVDGLHLYQDTCGVDFPPVNSKPLFDDVKACNGYYDHEHDEWLPIKEYYERFMK